MEQPEKYYERLVSAMVRGSLMDQKKGNVLFDNDLDYLSDQEHEELLTLGHERGLKTFFFQRVAILPSTKKVLDIIRGITPDNILDIGTGRGAFIWRLLDEYKNLPITVIDTSAERIEAISAVVKGGILNLNVKQMDARDLSSFPSEVFDVTTALKVLEFIEDIEQAIAEICRVTRRFIMVLFPVHPDNDPEKKHFFNKEQLEKSFYKNGVMQVSFEKLPNYHLLIARK